MHPLGAPGRGGGGCKRVQEGGVCPEGAGCGLSVLPIFSQIYWLEWVQYAYPTGVVNYNM